ncbi:MAG TPA: M24 family metallopeptidase [Xanthobacteraceae bacterium]|jgi:Xaa-Pro aminopeptidase
MSLTLEREGNIVRTMHPVLMTGVNEWNEDWLPRDEYDERLRALRQIMAEKGWDGLVIHGDCDRCPMVTYLTNYYPISRWSILFVGPEGEPKLLIAGGTRDIPAAVDQSNLREMFSYGNADKLLPEWITGVRGRSRARIGSYGFATMRPPVHQTILAVLEAIAEPEQADDLLDEQLLQRKRPREVRMITMASEIVHRALDSLAVAFRSGAAATEAAIAAERTARLAGVQDVRILVSFDAGRTLQPFIRMKPTRQNPQVAYVAARYCGYWSEAMATLSPKPYPPIQAAVSELDSMIKELKPGMSGAQLSAVAEGVSAAASRHPLVRDRIGYGIGLSLEETPILRSDSTPIIREGGVYALHTGRDADDGAALTSAVVHVTGDSARILCGYPNS